MKQIRNQRKRKTKKRKRSESSSSSGSSDSDDDKKKKKKSKKDKSHDAVDNKDLKLLLLENKIGDMQTKNMEEKARQLEREIDQLKAAKNAPATTAPIIVNNNNNNNAGYTPQPQPVVIAQTRVVNQVVYVKPNRDSQIVCTANCLSVFFFIFANVYLFCVWPTVTNKRNTLLYSNVMNLIILILLISIPK